MRSDLTSELSELAPSPAGRFDFARTWARARQLRRRRILYSGIVVCLLAAVATLFALPLDLSRISGVGPASTPSEAQVQSDPESELKEIAGALRSQMAVLNAELDRTRESREEITAQLRSEPNESPSRAAQRRLKRRIDALDEQTARIARLLNDVRQSLRAVESRRGRTESD